MASVSLDVFHLPEVEWQNNKYDSFLLCVDRHSGWMIAKPTLDKGLTGEKAAHLLIDQTWGELGIPSIVTSDRGPQFISQWWQTTCSRLGIRQAYSQAYHHQANGRAEVAGRILKDTLRALLIDKGIHWVEALPRALRILNDTPDPLTGLSPYEIMFGRTRNLGTLPWEPTQKSYAAEEFLQDMQDLDQEIAKALNNHHENLERTRNARRKERKNPYQIGDQAWVQRPNETGGIKLDTRYHGPYRVTARTGEHSYQVLIPGSGPLDVHISHMKPCHWETITGPCTYMQIPPVPNRVPPTPSD